MADTVDVPLDEIRHKAVKAINAPVQAVKQNIIDPIGNVMREARNKARSNPLPAMKNAITEVMDTSSDATINTPPADATAAIDAAQAVSAPVEAAAEAVSDTPTVSEAFSMLFKALTGKRATTDPSTWSVFKTFITKLFLYLPTSLVMFGFIADAIQEEVRYSIASFIGIASVFLNSIIGLLINVFVKSTTTSGMLGCTVPGFESLESIFAPQGIVLPVSIFTYFFIDFGLNRPPSENIGTAVLFGVYLLTHIVVLWSSGCFSRYYWTNPLITIQIGLAIGAVLGSIGYGIVHSVAPQRLPTGTYISPPASSSSGGSSTPSQPFGPGGTPLGASSSSVGRCSAPNDQDQFVCESYKNGKLVSST